MERVYPSKRIKKVFKKVVEGTPVSVAMEEVGYSKASAKNPKNVTNTRAWQELLNKYVSDTKLARVLNEGLGATKMEDDNELPDYSTRHKYLETGLKLKSKYPQEAGPMVAVQVNVNEDREKFR